VLVEEEDLPIETRFTRLLAAARQVLRQHLGVRPQWDTLLTLATLLPADVAHSPATLNATKQDA
jgi:hypothetical protein